MDLGYGPEYEDYRQEVRAFLDEHWPSAAKSPERVQGFRRFATEHGYLYRLIPKKYGGGGQEADPLKAQVVREEFRRAGAPQELGGISVQMLVPTLLDRGEEWQKERFIPPTLTGECVWCQGYSEPGSGSDLASLRTSAVLEDGEWVINGQKVWTTGGQYAQYMFILCRTEPGAPKHNGISYLLLDMRQPGVEVRPLKQITGTAEFNEVFFTNARTPADWIVGERGEGWSVANTTLVHERNMVGSISASDHLFNSVVKLAQRRSVSGRPAIEDPETRDRLVRIQGSLEAQRYSGLIQFTKSLKNQSSGILPMLNKLNNTNIGHDVASLAADLLGPLTMLSGDPTSVLSPSLAGSDLISGDDQGDVKKLGDERFMNQFLGSLGLAIAGGTSNIQRNIIAERGLGLPKEPSATSG
jgi:alkylation response protein AidB-like acyl-CoA dehydrogenase